MLLTWILPMSLLTGFMGRSFPQPPKVMPTPDKAASTSVFVPEPTSPPVITQGSGTR
jgi:hypothetical protein